MEDGGNKSNKGTESFKGSVSDEGTESDDDIDVLCTQSLRLKQLLDCQ